MSLTIQELAKEAAARGINLGKNPVRTIRYYTSIGLLRHPDMESVGKTKVAQYTGDYLAVLDIIDRYKSQGYSLAEISDLLQQPLYWSQAAVNFMKPIVEAKGYPEDAFRTDVPVTRGSMVVFIEHTLDALTEGRIARDFLDSAFVDKDGQPAMPLTKQS
jgi:DNA-binding transcriptional MerR regulator